MESKVMCDYKIAFDLGYKDAKRDYHHDKEYLLFKLKRIQYFLIFNTILIAINLFVYYVIASSMDNKFLFLFLLYLFQNIVLILGYRRNCRDLKLKT